MPVTLCKELDFHLMVQVMRAAGITSSRVEATHVSKQHL